MKIFFPSMHGAAASEIGYLCKRAGVEMVVPFGGNTLIRTLVKDSDEPWLTQLGVRMAKSDDEIRETVKDCQAIMVSTPEQIDQLRENIFPIKEVPFIVRHGLNSFKKFNERGTKNFLSCSQLALETMVGCNGFLSRKLMPWEIMPKPNPDVEGRVGFFSYIHSYRKSWSGAAARFDRLNQLIHPTVVVCYGDHNPEGRVDDLNKMLFSRGTVHIKDGQAVCNAVIRSMAMGTPVFMDRLTYNKCHFDQIYGLYVYETIEDLSKHVKLVNGSDDLLEQLVVDTIADAKKQFTYTDELGDRFKTYLENLR